jgi:hypothetical protein
MWAREGRTGDYLMDEGNVLRGVSSMYTGYRDKVYMRVLSTVCMFCQEARSLDEVELFSFEDSPEPDRRS